MKKLNRDKDYYQVMGHAGAAFEQDGCLFDDEGNEVVEAAAEELETETGGDNSALVEEIGRLKDLLSQKDATLSEASADLEKALDREATANLKAADLEKRVNAAEKLHEEEVSRADGLQAKVAELEANLVELSANTVAPAAGAADGQLPLDGGNGKAPAGGKK